jgi:ferric-dicitrate binding protein FerR (iron transport regulator)
MDTKKDKIDRFTSDKYSFNDYLSVPSGFQQEEQELITSMEGDWNETEFSPAHDVRLNKILVNLHQQIEERNQPKHYTIRSIYKLFSKIAAILIIPALITISILTYITVNAPENEESWAEIHAPLGSRTKFKLPDGSVGWLNSGSMIKYPINFRKDRKVEVTGEVWFDVVHLHTSDFRVITPYFNVKVVGTQFNVIAYENETTVEVILERGKVLLLDKHDQVKGELNPDQQLVFHKLTKELVKSNIDSRNYTSWKDGLLVFKNVPMTEIARRLERKYNTEIVLHGDSLKSSVFRATFLDENIDEICKMLSTVAPIRYKIHKREKQADSTFTSSKIDMWLK